MLTPCPALRRQVLTIYKELLHLGKDYPTGYTHFRQNLHKAFIKNISIVDEDEIKANIKRAEFVKRVKLTKDTI
ncbi:hypothetical protein BGT96224_2224 [Blumeria graminis f. sp. tritici 96224]|uniref:Uncharacterized protein n=1 Tax=Blumeria graminis f. sp. tritici 96224 TaxID=1268274 RepID=A0A656KMV5_BLUGR|nr:hypothetical protein BGT96224_2224 [Blumeria graminis f. sp. tritici 96224]